MNTEEMWAGEFGDKYQARNRVDWRKRIPFWREILDLTGARSAYEIGCGPGWNLSAIKAASRPRDARAPVEMVHVEWEGWDVNVAGEDINTTAVAQATTADPLVGENWFDLDDFYQAELSFTAGCLIHIPPAELEKMMRRVVEQSTDYILAVEYHSDEEREIPYQGHDGMCWARPYGKLYRDMGLKQVLESDAGPGFDDCRAYLFRRP